MFDYLKNTYEPQGLAHQYSRYQNWAQLKFDEKELQHFCNHYTSAVANLREGKLAIDDTIVVYQFLLHMSPFYDTYTAHIRQTMRAETDRTKLPSHETIVRALLDEQKARNVELVANIDVNDSGKAYQAGPKRQQRRCEHSNKVGHSKETCWKLHLEQVQLHPRKNVGIQEDTNSSVQHQSFLAKKKKVVTAVAALSVAKDAESWIVDSGCSDHMCNNIQLMKQCEPCDAVVNIGKGSLKALPSAV